ncbi:hypothetical protein VitviT2T_014101 [Vitis vinifera]|uniref:PI4-kinase N-terminal domain-containing protein n=1 Tax=Vitis vinifera TaxID=29760 RepID=A0ABY9CIP5_VITVI|nr:hypothetical protein VitviT2T_014101 [Vitis vinifera]
MRFQLVPVDKQVNQVGRTNWQVFLGFPGGHETQNCNGVVHNLNLVDLGAVSWLEDRISDTRNEAEIRESTLSAHACFLIKNMPQKEEHIRDISVNLLSQSRERFLQGLLQEKLCKANTWQRAQHMPDVVSLLSEIRIGTRKNDSWISIQATNVPTVIVAAAAASGANFKLIDAFNLEEADVTKFSGTLRGVTQNFSLAAIYDVEAANHSASLQKISMSDLNVDEKHIAFAKFSEKHRLFLLLDMCDMKSNDRLLLEDAMIEMKINQLGKSLIDLAMFETTSNANSMHQAEPFSPKSIGLVDFENDLTTYSKSKQIKSNSSAVET